jgi:hypothetical protein
VPGVVAGQPSLECSVPGLSVASVWFVCVVVGFCGGEGSSLVFVRFVFSFSFFIFAFSPLLVSPFLGKTDSPGLRWLTPTLA